MKIFDMHCDTLQKLTDFGGELVDNSYHFDIKRAKMPEIDYIQTFAAFIDRENDLLPPFERCRQLIDTYYRQIEKNNEAIMHCQSSEDMKAAFESKRIAAFLSIEGGEAIAGDIDKLRFFYKKGVRIMTLCWNYDNEICGGIEKNNCGLTPFGKKVVAEMNRIGMLIDVSHASEQSFRDVVEASEKPVAATHSNARIICGHKRNLTDEQICTLIKMGGCIGVNFYSDFIAEKECKISDLLRHIEHILSLGGENNVGIGSDFDGMTRLPQEIKGVEDICRLTDEMQKLGYSDLLIKKIMADNFLNLMKKILI
ncbi:MAG: dipeptidase [Clostridia bacterium]|nr:dipeptidase [Clostridia bacterium]